MKHYQDETYLVHRFKKDGDHKYNDKTLEEVIKLMDNNFKLSDDIYNQYSFMKLQLNNEKLLFGERIRYRKEIKEIKDSMSGVIEKTWSNLMIYNKVLPSNIFKMYLSFPTFSISLASIPIVEHFWQVLRIEPETLIRNGFATPLPHTSQSIFVQQKGI